MDPPTDHLFGKIEPPAPLPPRAEFSIGPPSANNNPLGSFPPEIRRLIILEAFGNRTLHMDLAFMQPPFRLRSSFSVSHVNYRTERRNGVRPPRWEWWGWECQDGPLQVWDKPVDSDVNKPRPANDFCGHLGKAHHDYDLVRPAPRPRFIGILGWLLSCRDTYLETVNVLYGNNTLHIARMYLFVGLPRLFMPERLAAIRNIELLWDFRLSRSDRGSLQSNTISTLLRTLHKTLPSLRRLYLSFQGDICYSIRYSPVDTRFRMVEEILQLTDWAVVRLPHLVECRIALPKSIYTPWKFVKNGDHLETGDLDGSIGAVWRDLPGQDEHRGDGESSLEGYWVCHGKSDWPNGFIMDLVTRGSLYF